MNMNSRRRKAEGGRRNVRHYPLPTTHYSAPPSALRPPPSAFTLTELLVTITIIGILASLVLGAMHASREAAHEYATKATIVKLNNIILERYESYITRRVPIDTSVLSPEEAAVNRLYAIRDLMRMEMPDRSYDVNDDPIILPNSTQQMTRPALSSLYYNRLNPAPPPGNGIENGAAELLYLIVSMGSPEALEQFHTAEIGDTNENGIPEFLDGWGQPIFFLRWAPDFMGSDIQTNDPISDHDPFDTRHVDNNAWSLIPLIYSAGPDGKLGLQTHAGSTGYHFAKDAATSDMFSDTDFREIGQPTAADGSLTDYHDNITNHHIEQR